MSSTRRLERLVDQRFSRPLSASERQDLEAHLAASPIASERYRRLHLMERVAALGPERALEEPSPLEVQRIANDLGLLAPDPEPSFLAWLTSFRTVGITVFAAAAFAAAVLLIPTPELVQERGGTAWSASAYAVSSGGVERLGPTASRDTHLKFRVTRDGDSALTALSVVVKDASGATHVVPLEAPAFEGDTASVPGALALDAFPPGRTTFWLVRGAPDDVDPAALGDAVIERFEVELDGGPPK